MPPRKPKTEEATHDWTPDEADDSPPRELLRAEPPTPDPATHDRRHLGRARVRTTAPSPEPSTPTPRRRK
jgi:hypothetical protein